MHVFQNRRPLLLNSLPDFSGFSFYNILALWAVDGYVVNHPIKVRVHDGVMYTSNEHYVFFDANNEISLDSKVSETTTPTAISLGDLVGSDSADVTTWIDIRQGEVLSLVAVSGTTVGKAEIISSGSLVTKAGKPGVRMNGAWYESNVNSPKIRGTQSFTLILLSTQEETEGVSSALGVIGPDDTARFCVVHDERPTIHRIGFARYIGNAVNYFSDALADYSSADPKLLITTHNRLTGNNSASFLDGVYQNAVTIPSGDWGSDILTFGSLRNTTTGPTNLVLQMGLVSNDVFTFVEAGKMKEELDKYYNF